MGSTTVIGSYVASGDNASSEVQNLQLVYSWGDVYMSGGLANVAISTALYVKRDAYGPSSGKTQTGYIDCGEGRTSSFSVVGTIDTTYRLVHTASWTVSYDPAYAKTITFGAYYNVASNTKLKGLILPSTSYTNGSAWQSGGLTVTFPAQLSACGAPTVINSGGIIPPTGSFLVSWGGGSNGVGNSVTGYHVFWRINAYPTAAAYDGVAWVATGSSAGQYTISVSNYPRGATIYVGVRTYGSAGDGYISGMALGTGAKINSLPSAPTVGPNSGGGITVKSTGDNITFTMVAGTDADASQTKTIAYSIGTGAKTFITSPFTTALLTSATTFNFYTFDGLEYSAPTVKNITINIKPVINSCTFTGTSLKAKQLITSSSLYIVEPIITPVLSKEVGNGTYKYKIRTGTYKTFSATVTEAAILSTDLIDIRRAIGLNKWYQIGIYFNDGIEDSNIFWQGGGVAPANGTSNLCFCIPPAPELENIFNQHGNVNVTGSNPIHFYNKARFVLGYDEGFNEFESISYYTANGVESLATKDSSWVNVAVGSDTLLTQDITLPNNLTGGTVYTFKINLRRMKDNNAMFSQSVVSSTRTRVPETNVNNLTFSWSKFVPFTMGKATNIGELRFTNWTATQSIDYAKYSLIAASCFKIGFLQDDYQFKAIVPTTINDSIIFNIKGDLLYSTLPTEIPKIKSYTLGLTVSITNAFGMVSSGIINNYEVDFRESVITAGMTSTLYGGNVNKTTFASIASQSKYLKEGLSLFYTGSVKSYNGEVNGQIYIKRSTTGVWETYGDSFAFIPQSAIEPTPGNPITHTLTNKFFKLIGQIIDKQYTSDFKLVVSDSGGLPPVEVILNTAIPVRGHTTGSLVISNAEYIVEQNNYFFCFDYKNSDFGMVTINAGFISNFIYTPIATETIKSIPFLGTLATFISGTSMKLNNQTGSVDTWLSVHGFLEIITTDDMILNGEHFISTYQTTSNTVLVYNSLPTVALRKNYLGINTKDFSVFDSTSLLLAISEYTGREEICFFSSENGVKSINVRTGAMDGFVIDSGSWDVLEDAEIMETADNLTFCVVKEEIMG